VHNSVQTSFKEYIPGVRVCLKSNSTLWCKVDCQLLNNKTDIDRTFHHCAVHVNMHAVTEVCVWFLGKSVDRVTNCSGIPGLSRNCRYVSDVMHRSSPVQLGDPRVRIISLLLVEELFQLAHGTPPEKLVGKGLTAISCFWHFRPCWTSVPAWRNQKLECPKFVTASWQISSGHKFQCL